MDEEKGLAGDFAAAAVADLAGPALGHAHARTGRLGAPAPVRNPIGPAHRVGSEAVDRARRSGFGPVGERAADVGWVGFGIGSRDGEEGEESEQQEGIW